MNKINYSMIMILLIFRKTFFDQIDEDIKLPPEYWGFAAIGFADRKIIMTSFKYNFTLLWSETNGWSETLVEFSDQVRGR